MVIVVLGLEHDRISRLWRDAPLLRSSQAPICNAIEAAIIYLHHCIIASQRFFAKSSIIDPGICTAAEHAF